MQQQKQNVLVPAKRKQMRSQRHLARKRSEEHTSELQSQSNLVCRLLLEKKKTPSMPCTPVRSHPIPPFRSTLNTVTFLPLPGLMHAPTVLVSALTLILISTPR